MTKYTVEHTTYKHGCKDEDETTFSTQARALEFALGVLQRFGGRVWVNGAEYTQSQLKQEMTHGN